MGHDDKKKQKQSLEETIVLRPEAAADFEDVVKRAAALDIPLDDDGTVRLSAEDQRRAARGRAVPFEEEGTAPPKLTDAERRALKGTDFTGTVAITPPKPTAPPEVPSGSHRIAAPSASDQPRHGVSPWTADRRTREGTPVADGGLPVTDKAGDVTEPPRLDAERTPEPDAPGPSDRLAGASAEPEQPTPPRGERAEPPALRGVKRSSQDSRSSARVLAELLTTEDGELDRYRKRRVTGSLDATGVARVRDMLAALAELVEAAEPEDAASLRSAWESLYPVFKRRFDRED